MDALSLQQSLWAATAVAAGAIVQGSVGFGSALIAAPLLVLVHPGLVPGPTLACNFVLTVLIAIRERQGMELGGVGWALLGRLPGVALGTAALLSMPVAWLSPVFALLVLLAVALSLSGLKLSPQRSTLLSAGLLSGVMGTISSIGGPPIALVYQHADAQRLRGTLAGYFTCSTLMSIAALARAGLFGLGELRAILVLLPGALLGFVASYWTRGLLDRGRTRPVVLTLSSVAAVGVLLRSLT